jgi:hypothetical protein
MIDFIKADICNAILQDWTTFVKVRDVVSPLLENTGEVLNTRTIEEGSYKLKYTIQPATNVWSYQTEFDRINHVYLTGSMHKAHQGNYNHKDFDFIDLWHSTFNLCNQFQINPHLATMHQLEVGANIQPINTTSGNIIENTFSYKSRQFAPLRNKYKTPFGVVVDQDHQNTKMYHKTTQLKHLGLTDDVLRYEIGFPRMRRAQNVSNVFTMADVVNYTKMTKLCNYANHCTGDILFLNEEPSAKNPTRKDLELLENWKNTNYINQLRKTDLRKYRRERNRYQEITRDNETNNGYQFRELVRSKFVQLLQTDRQTIQEINYFLNQFEH